MPKTIETSTSVSDTCPSGVDSPLAMTVHQLGESTAAHDPERVRSGRLKMLLVVLVCAAPVVASYFSFYVIRPEGRRNYGTLVTQRAMPDQLKGTTLGGVEFDLKLLKEQWLLVSVGPASCGADCEKRLYQQRQLRQSLGRDKERLDWVWLITDEAPLAPVLVPALAGATVLRVPAASVGAWMEPESGRALTDHLYVVDPMGNWMMRFPAEVEWGKAKRDIERLLRASNSWDQAGRVAQPAGMASPALVSSPKLQASAP